MASERTWLTEVLARTPQEHLDRHEAPISHKFLRLEPAAPATTATTPSPREESSSSTAASSSAQAPAAATTEGDSEGAAQSTSEQGEGLASSANRPKREAPRGKNKRLSKKQRRAEAHAMLQSELCTNVAQGRECTRAKCVASHDLQDYLSKREPDLSAFPCPQVAELGYCWLGFKCRFLSSHLSADGKLVFPTPMPERRDIYVLDQTTVIALRKRKHRFPRTSAAIAAIAQNERAAAARQPVPTTPTATADSAAAATTTTTATTTAAAAATDSSSTVAAPATDDATPTTTAAAATTTTETVQQPVDSSTSSSSSSSSAASAASSSSDAVVSASSETSARASLLLDDDGARVPKKQIDWQGKLILAPLTTIGNLPYRRICKQFGADITVSEMALASKILETSAAELALLKRHPSEDIFGVQLAGRTGQQVAEAIELLRDHSSVTADFFDINAGCPIDLVFNQGMGSALCARPQQRMRNILQAASAVSDVPVTVKIRMGVHTGEPNAHTYIASLGDWGASAVTLHGRSRQARYSMRADWDYIGQCAKIATIPLIGNGDVYNWEDAVHHLESSASALLVARGGIIKPWLFREIKERKHIDISASERLDIVKEFCQYGLLHWGSDARGVDTTRRFLLEWLSFLHRYIPVGLLDVLPSKIAHRIPTQWGFYGRSDLETKMASANPIDWIQISEMFLGPVADGYSFTPKHRAEAYTRIDNRSNLASSSSTGEPQPVEEDFEEVQG